MLHVAIVSPVWVSRTDPETNPPAGLAFSCDVRKRLSLPKPWTGRQNAPPARVIRLLLRMSGRWHRRVWPACWIRTL